MSDWKETKILFCSLRFALLYKSPPPTSSFFLSPLFNQCYFQQVFIFRCQLCHHSSQLSFWLGPICLHWLCLVLFFPYIHSSLIVPDLQVPLGTCLNIISEGRVPKVRGALLLPIGFIAKMLISPLCIIIYSSLPLPLTHMCTYTNY